jgi:tRNA pseudouridine-54 N-methylase
MGFPPEIYDIIMAIQASFFLSHKIRTNTEVLLAFLDEDLVLHYIGSELRFLGPDERSIGMLLMKALEKKDAAREIRIQSTPGIWIQKKKIEDLFRDLSEDGQIIIVNEDADTELQGIFPKNTTLIIPNFQMGTLGIEKYFSNRILFKFKVQDLPINRRTYLTILKFHSFIDKMI